MSEPIWVPLGGETGPQGPQGATGAQGPQGPSGQAVWMTGDQKISLQNASHDDPGGGRWLLMDGSAIPAQYTALIAMCGANLPDAKGRGLWMLGTHADVNALGDNEGAAIAGRTPQHWHGAGPTDSFAQGGADRWTIGGGIPGLANARTSGEGVANKPSYCVVGNLFVHT